MNFKIMVLIFCKVEIKNHNNNIKMKNGLHKVYM